LKGFITPRPTPVNKYPAIGKTYQIQYSVFAKIRELPDEIIDKGTVKLAALYMIGAIACLPVFHVILQLGMTVRVLHFRHVITSFENTKKAKPLGKAPKGLQVNQLWLYSI
jgi:hypothetical protein